MATHRITTQGRTIYVTKTRPGFGVDETGVEWPLFVRPGHRGYKIKSMDKSKKRKTNRASVDTELRSAEIALQEIKDGADFGEYGADSDGYDTLTDALCL